MVFSQKVFQQLTHFIEFIVIVGQLIIRRLFICTRENSGKQSEISRAITKMSSYRFCNSKCFWQFSLYFSNCCAWKCFAPRANFTISCEKNINICAMFACKVHTITYAFLRLMCGKCSNLSQRYAQHVFTRLFLPNQRFPIGLTIGWFFRKYWTLIVVFGRLSIVNGEDQRRCQ